MNIMGLYISEYSDSIQWRSITGANWTSIDWLFESVGEYPLDLTDMGPNSRVMVF